MSEERDRAVAELVAMELDNDHGVGKKDVGRKDCGVREGPVRGYCVTDQPEMRTKELGGNMDSMDEDADEDEDVEIDDDEFDFA